MPWRRGPPPAFNLGTSLRLDSLTPEQAEWLKPQLGKLLGLGALQEARHPARWVSRAFLVPKPNGAGWRLVFDLRYLNQFCRTMRLEMETLKRLRLLARRDDWMVSFDLADGFYHVGIHEADRKYFQVAIAGQLYEFAALPMGWSLSPAIFCAVMSVWTTWARAPAAVEARAAGRRHAKDHRPLVFDPGPEGRACWRRLRRSGVRILPLCRT